jgi:nucleoside-diphosphate-sugar epimerase
MPTVLVCGDGGLIGTAVSSGFRRAGWRVYGLIRREQHAEFLLANEVIPLIGNIDEPESYLEVVKLCSVVIDASGCNAKLIEAIQGLNAEEEVECYKKLLIVTSGTLNWGGWTKRRWDI